VPSRSIPFRLVALIVLLTAASDYSHFDQVDPCAPMNSAGVEAIVGPAPQSPLTVNLRVINLPDDRCLFCTPWIQPQPPTLSRVILTSRVTQSAKISLPSSDPVLIELPPKA
jgi:hypothetical protein